MSAFEEPEKKAVAVGPWGSQNGLMWDDGVYSTVRQLVIAHGSGIDSIQVEYDSKGSSFWSDKHGGNGGWKIDTVQLDYPEEFLTSFHGYYGKISEWGTVSLRSITFKSNKRSYGPFGMEQGTYFSLPVTTGNKIVGFHGKSGWYVDAIGAHLKPVQNDQNNYKVVMAQTQYSYMTGGTDIPAGYSLLQNCDVFLAIRPKDDSVTTKPAAPVPNKIYRQFSNSSGDSSDEGIKHKTPTIERLPSKVEGVVTYGPWGGSGGFMFDDGVYSGIRQIKLSRNIGVVYIKVEYDCDGEAVWGGRHGGTGGYKSDRIIFDYPNEILTHITGTFGPVMGMGPNVIKSMSFHTTKKKHGPYGEEQGTQFSTQLREGKIVGIHGRTGLFLDAIGVHAIEGKVKVETTKTSTETSPPLALTNSSHNAITAMVPKEPAGAVVLKEHAGAILAKDSAGAITEIDQPHWSSKLVRTNKGPVEEVTCGVVKEPAPCGPGPWGGDGGRAWDDGVFTGIRQIHLTRSAEGICSMQIEYDRSGQFIWSVKHGGNGGTSPHRIKLEYPHEVLSCISGYYSCISKNERPQIIKSLTFYTSRGKYGPFGEEVGTFFTSTTTEGKVVGFHGRSSLYLDAIGVHMQHWLGSTQKTSRISLFKKF
ncbi:PREDICTED: jacalin-related lectin 3 [Fragaria vesca subsp. vesca]|uniref:jacalin-related lectin 3 n=1 Tax=Fragaria vesca subsp. vesca TaxID=101020 RepID=UPI0002C354F4|nr:PREDICTED: jacalin-related lectin 3 [Fragaria vesca subsp. vesca]